jgi:hypothetical protein
LSELTAVNNREHDQLHGFALGFRSEKRRTKNEERRTKRPATWNQEPGTQN